MWGLGVHGDGRLGIWETGWLGHWASLRSITELVAAGDTRQRSCYMTLNYNKLRVNSRQGLLVSAVSGRSGSSSQESVCWVVGGGGVEGKQLAVEGRLLGLVDEQVLLLGSCVDGLVGNGGYADT